MQELKIEHICKVIKGVSLLKDVSLTITKGHIYGIVGRNGSGKTVLLKCICGFMPITSGKILQDGVEIGKDTEFIRDTGFIIENPSFLSGKSGLKNLKYLAGIRKKANEERLRECMKIVGLDPTNDKTVGKYSLGMRQRLGIAQVLMEDPDFILLDEPMNGLDNEGVVQMRELFIKLKQQGKTFLVVSHNRYDIEALCDEVYEMDAGMLKKLKK